VVSKGNGATEKKGTQICNYNLSTSIQIISLQIQQSLFQTTITEEGDYPERRVCLDIVLKPYFCDRTQYLKNLSILYMS
jgi:hypothetical protein